MSESTSYAACMLCEATCGIEVRHENGRVTSIRGDDKDPISQGHICPKAAALADLHTDPDRVRHPQRRVGDAWEPVGWESAVDDIGRRIHEIQQEHGPDAVAVYAGNPNAHAYGTLLLGRELLKVIGTRNVYTANSTDGLPRLWASSLIYGNQFLSPVPDIDRTKHLLILGANPVVSNGSMIVAPGIKRRLRAIAQRGGRWWWSTPVAPRPRPSPTSINSSGPAPTSIFCGGCSTPSLPRA